MDWEMTLRNEREKGREEGREEGRRGTAEASGSCGRKNSEIRGADCAVGKGRSLISVKAMDECRDKCNPS